MGYIDDSDRRTIAAELGVSRHDIYVTRFLCETPKLVDSHE